MAQCRQQAISFEANHPVFNRQKCVLCKECASVCLQNAIKFAGETISVSGIMNVIRRDKDYYMHSGGGVTFSGGEAFYQFDGLMALLTSCKEEGIHTAIETCGQVLPDNLKEAYPLTDLFLFDVKHSRRALLKKETGADLDVVLANLAYLAERDPEKVVVRIPVLPGFNFNKKDIRQIFNLARQCSLKNIHLLPYHALGKSKYEQMGLPYTFPCDSSLPEKALIPLKEMGEKMQLKVEIGSW
jgi:pyruvate formate lyase activating enzyme